MSKFPFKGFSGKEKFTQIPNEFFRELLSEIDDLNELKITLYALWRVANMEGASHPLWEQDFAEGLNAVDISSGLEKCVLRGSLLKVTIDADVVYFLNSPRGRASAEAARESGWVPSKRNSTPPLTRPNIYQLYEENIGPLTPLLADTLKDAEDEYEIEKIEEAIGLAVKANARNWRYVEAILKSWKEEGYGKKQNRQDDSKDRNRYVQGDYADFID
ncbi:MAG: DnaD domain protein [Anaerolineae bacterium]|jgi:DnaD/phage-associated family protein|nr:DnaD domain protein [Anaerolineae bacterium]MBT4311867.1 DnaD domain protein [Anaerolineae bacterium]MBT4458065.1 DnaD domain protein [Anaerolineae bacterium]MBT4842507.1 DnaD domain protein [Anaerolineae bacterium]MBT6059979.1 DnaD domain protein [Anaerolineae bacterium]